MQDNRSSGVGVLDKAAHILDCLEAGPATLSQLVEATGLARPTAHRLAVALTHHRLVARDVQGRFMLGPRLGELSSAAGEDRLIAAAGPVLNNLRNITGESSQVFRRQGDWRVCVASAERPIGLRDTIPVGTQLSMKADSYCLGRPCPPSGGPTQRPFLSYHAGSRPTPRLGPVCR